MKWMQWVMVLALGAGMGLAGLGCDDSSSSSSDSLVGTWNAQSFNGESLGNNVSLRINFRSNGEFETSTTINGATDSDSGTWSAQDGILTTVSGGDRETTPYNLNGNTLTLGPPGEVFVLKR